MSLIKLAAYSLLGYVLYELYLGVTAGVEANRQAAQQAPAPAARKRAPRTVSVEDSTGARTKRQVGRGVI